MKVAIVGAGAIGGWLGARLSSAGGCEVSVLARGATLAALRQHGWQLQERGELIQCPVKASDHPADLGPQDLVIIAVKGPALASVAGAMQPMLREDTAVMPAMNGVPWWITQVLPLADKSPLATLDPQGVIASVLPVGRVIGCVVHASASTVSPGVVKHQMGNRLVVGEACGGLSDRVLSVARLLMDAGIDTTASASIRNDIWYKLWGNLTMNPVSAITGATIDRLLDDPLVTQFCSDAMTEAAEIGRRIGLVINQSPQDRHEVTRKLGAFKTSMLQDAQAGRPLELDSIVGAVHELGGRAGVATPNIAAVLGLARLFASVHGLYPANGTR
ncbi:MAG: 2-dehydropantoate 2-reductase [Burkholderiales bacterium]|nr:2-dehydropantoate 2-reductase [Burkholderiales bacterium]